MPIHDWTRVDAGLFHAFHQSWIIKLCDSLNDNRLPADYLALPEQSIRGPILDVLTLELAPGEGEPDSSRPAAGLAVASVPPRTRLVRQAPIGSTCVRPIGSRCDIDTVRLSPWSSRPGTRRARASCGRSSRSPQI